MCDGFPFDDVWVEAGMEDSSVGGGGGGGIDPGFGVWT
jgi:hypothetical protein